MLEIGERSSLLHGYMSHRTWNYSNLKMREPF
uniref:Uncharacterized protein n=1 Tax=Anguilla anguilla TaxID=7936 RepID=A0A0E9XK05_ANGAN